MDVVLETTCVSTIDYCEYKFKETVAMYGNAMLSLLLWVQIVRH